MVFGWRSEEAHHLRRLDRVGSGSRFAFWALGEEGGVGRVARGGAEDGFGGVRGGDVFDEAESGESDLAGGGGDWVSGRLVEAS